jgi:hypothetical protein
MNVFGAFELDIRSHVVEIAPDFGDGLMDQAAG